MQLGGGKRDFYKLSNPVPFELRSQELKVLCVLTLSGSGIWVFERQIVQHISIRQTPILYEITNLRYYQPNAKLGLSA